MNISLEMVLTRFFLEYPDLKTEYRQTKQQLFGIRLLPEHTDDLQKEYLYVTSAYDGFALEKADREVSIVCLTRDPDTHTALPNVTLLHTDLPVAEVFNTLQKCFHEFTEWERQLGLAVFRDASIQEFVDLSEGILDSPLLFYDPALKLLAYSKSHVPEDPVFQSVIDHGFLDLDTVRRFDKERVFESLGSTGQFYGPVNDSRRHADFSRAINIRNDLAVYCILLYTEGGLPQTYINQLFHILCDHIQDLLEKQHSDFVKNRSVSDYFLMDLLDNPDTPKEHIRERIQFSELDYEGNYIVISIHGDAGKKTARQYLIHLLRNNLISCRIFPYREHIVILYNLPKFRETDYRDYLCAQFENILKGSGSKHTTLFFSRPFTNIGQFSAAYIQAENTCRISDGEAKQQFFFYEDCLIQDLFLMNESSDKRFSYCHPALLEMLKKGAKKSRQQLRILYEYLNHDRNHTDVAARLDMHRNNVIYHIKNIEETYRLDLDDPSVRLKLLLSFELLKYEERNAD